MTPSSHGARVRLIIGNFAIAAPGAFGSGCCVCCKPLVPELECKCVHPMAYGRAFVRSLVRHIHGLYFSRTRKEGQPVSGRGGEFRFTQPPSMHANSYTMPTRLARSTRRR